MKGATLIGNGPDALTRVSAIGNDMRLDTGVGVCGKEGQSVPVGVGQPTLRIDWITVGGTAVIRALLAAATVALLAGCAASVVKGSESSMRVPPASASALVLNVTGSKDSLASSDWEDFKREWQENFAAQAAIAHVAFSMQDGPATPTGQDGTLLSVFVNDYRFIRPGTRYVTGIFSGNAFIESTFRYASLKTGDTFGVHTVNTTSTAWQGVFSAMTNKQVEAIAADVMQQLRSSAPPGTARAPAMAASAP